ncbi:MAG: leucine-rich repeat domain-containing protein, partial [Firmicutes bacterium]|nr:leucine-rich repeat domain-containing protein [Bacillota bacterium]
LTDIGAYAFDTSSITNINLPSTVRTIGDWAFSTCTSLPGITLPEGLTTINLCAFFSCVFTSIVIPSTATSIGDGAFYNCQSLTSVIIAEGVSYLGYSAFFDCKLLSSIVIPVSLTSIQPYAFWGCTALASVFYGGNMAQWGAMTFNDLNEALTGATRYYYSTENTMGHWRYVGGVPNLAYVCAVRRTGSSRLQPPQYHAAEIPRITGSSVFICSRNVFSSVDCFSKSLYSKYSNKCAFSLTFVCFCEDAMVMDGTHDPPLWVSDLIVLYTSLHRPQNPFLCFCLEEEGDLQILSFLFLAGYLISLLPSNHGDFVR